MKWPASDRALQRALEVASVLLCATLVLPTTADPDLWGHLRFGLDMLETGSIPSADPYSFTSDQPWVNHEWLAELAMGISYTLAGAAGLVGLKLALFGLFLGALSLALRDASPFARFGMIAFVTLASLAIWHAVRPQLWSLTLLAALFATLTHLPRHPRMWLALTGIFIVWANTHGGWIIGLFVMGGWLADAVICRTLTIRRAVLSGVAASLATLLTPYGVGLWRFVAATVRTSRTDITEWLPVTTSPPALVFWTAATVLIALLVLRGDRRPVLLTAVALGYAAWGVQRVVPFFVLTAGWLAILTRRRGPRPARRLTGADRWIAGALSAGVLSGSVGAFVLQARVSSSCISLQATPAGPDQVAAAQLRALAPAGRMVTWFDWGEYAIWHFGPRLQVSMDGRRETVYSTNLRDAHARFLQGQPWPELDALKPTHIWVPAALPVATTLSERGWRPLIHTPHSTVWTNGAGADPPASSASTISKCFPG
jgi:hypothetical protein